MRHEHRARPAAGEGAQGRAGLRESAEEPRQEHHAPGEHGARRDGSLCLAVEGGTTKEAVFEAYVERILAPSLVAGQVVVLDNLSAHKGDRARELVEERGAKLLFLPSYSPDFSPIEEAFGKLKALLRRGKARTKEALLQAIGRALDAITSEDAKGWFGHCGYVIAQSL